MKATRYFSDYQSAYNYYGGNVVPSTEIALIGDGSYIFVSSDNAVSGNQQYFDVSMTNDEIVDTMTYTAYNNGVSYGEAIGYAQGYEGGYSYGYSYGYSEGEASGQASWEPIENVSGNLDNLSELGGTEEVIDLYWGTILDNFSREDILDENDNTTVIGIKFEWDETDIMVEEGGKQVDKTIHVVHEAMLENGSWPFSESGHSAQDWFSFAYEDGDFSNSFISEFYANVLPVLRNVTLVSAEQGSGYDYELNFESLVYENYQGDINIIPDKSIQNGLYIPGQAAGVNVDVEAAGGDLPDEQIEQMSMGMFMSGNDSVISNSGTFVINTFGMTSEYIKSRIDAEMGLYIDKYNTTDGLVDISASLDVTITYHEDGDDGYISAIIPLVTGDKVGFGFYSIETDPETGDSIISSDPSQYLKDVYLIDGNNNESYNHFHDIATTGNYEARWQLSMDPVSGDTIYEFTLQIVQ